MDIRHPLILLFNSSPVSSFRNGSWFSSTYSWMSRVTSPCWYPLKKALLPPTMYHACSIPGAQHITGVNKVILCHEARTWVLTFLDWQKFHHFSSFFLGIFIVRGGGGVRGRLASQYASQVTWPGGSASRAGSSASGGGGFLHPGGGGSASRGKGFCIQGVKGSASRGVGQRPPAGTGKAGSTHPTGMLPCSFLQNVY